MNDPTFKEAVGPELWAKTGWQRSLDADPMMSFGRADGTFRDVVCATRNARISTLSLNTCLWAYGILVSDTRTPQDVLQRIQSPLTDVHVRRLEETPLDQQHTSDLVQFMDCYNKARLSGRLRAEQVAHIDRLMEVMARLFTAKVRAERQG